MDSRHTREAQTKEHHFRQAVAHVQAKLKRSNDDVASLQKRVGEDEAKLSKDVSRDVPDDVVKSDISKFFQGDFFSWCADTCATGVAQQESVASFLRSIGIINSTQDYENAPRDLQFDMNLSDGSSPLVLLQAVLSAVLCETFLTNPFFLAEETADGLKEFETALSIDFARLSLRLSKIRTTISVLGMPRLADEEFQLESSLVQGEPTVVSALGERLNGRPIGVVIRPLIISEPVVPEDKPQQQVIWSKAIVWVSGK
ncbi:hypothetical protein ACO1O0_009192 [Amphichorda felina]